MKIVHFLIITLILVADIISAARHKVPDCTIQRNGELLPDLDDCSHYYKCDKGRANRRNCGRGFSFDKKLKTCNIAVLVNCNGKFAYEPVTDTEAPTKPTTPTSSPVPTIPTPTKITEPTTIQTFSTTTSHPCSTTTHPCPATTHEELTNTTTEEPMSTATEETTTTEKPVPASPLIGRNDCSSQDDGTYLYDTKHCRRFYVCRRGKLRREKCRPGYWFDMETLSCRNREDVTNCMANCN